MNPEGSDFIIRIILEAIDKTAPTIARVNAEVEALKRTASGGSGRQATPTSDLERGLKETEQAARGADQALKQNRQTVDQHTTSVRSNSASVREGGRALGDFSRASNDAEKSTRSLEQAHQRLSQRAQETTQRYQSFRKAISDGEVTRKDAARGMADFGRELNSVSRAFDAGSTEALKFGRMADQAIKQAKNDMPEAHGWLQKLVNATNDWGVSIVSLSAQLRGLGLAFVVGMAQQLNTAIVGLVGSLIAVASAASVAAAGLAGAFVSAAAQTIPVVTVLVAAVERLKAVFAASSEAQKLQQSQAVTSAQATKTQTSATDALANAQANLVNSQANLKNSYGQVADAQGRVVQSQLSLIDARRQAIRQIQDLVLAEKEAQLAAAGASITLAQAQQQLQQTILSGGTGTALASAQLQVQEAQLGQTRAQTDLPRAVSDAQLAQQRGVSGAPGVVSATQGVASARQGLAQARQGVVSARSQVAQNQRAVQQAGQSAANPTGAAQTAANTLNYMLSHLDAAEKRLYTVVTNLRNLFTGPHTPLSQATDAIVTPFANALDKVYKILSDPNNPVTKGLNVLGTALGGAMQKFVNRTFSKDTMNFFADMTKEAARNLPKVVDTLGNIFSILSNIAEAAKPVVRFLVDGFDAWTKKIDASTSSQGGMSKLQHFFTDSIPYIKSFIDLFASFAHLFAAVIGQAAPAGKGIIQDLTNSINKATAWIDSHGSQVRDFFNATARVLSNIGQVVLQIAKAMIGLFDPGTTKTFADLITNVILPVLSQALKILGFITNAIMFVFGSPGIGFIVKWGATAVATLLVLSKIFSGWFTLFGRIQSIWGKLFGKGGGGPGDGAGIAASMEEGGKVAGTTIADSMVAAGEKAAESIGAAMGAGGTEAGAEISAAEASGGAAAASEIGGAEAAGGVGVGAAGATGAAGTGGLLAGFGAADIAPIVASAATLALTTYGFGQVVSGVTGSQDAGNRSSSFIAGLAAGGGGAGGVPFGINSAFGFGSGGLRSPSSLGRNVIGGFNGSLEVGKPVDLLAALHASDFVTAVKNLNITDQPAKDLAKIRREAEQLSRQPFVSDKQRQELKSIVSNLDPVNVAIKKAGKLWGDTFQGINATTGNVMKQVQSILKTDIQNISDNLGTGTVKGAEALTASVTAAYDAITKNTTLAGKAVGRGLQQINKMLNNALKAMGAPSLQQADISAIGPQQTASWIQYQFTGGTGGTGPGARAMGGYEQPKPGGKIIQVAEGGYPEVVLTTDPKYASRQKMLLSQYLTAAPHVASYASGGQVNAATNPQTTGGSGNYVYPLSGFSLGRTDMGVDANAAPGTPIGPIGRSRVGGITPNWYRGQPYINWELLDGPAAHRWVYVAEQISNLASPGSILQPNQSIAKYAGSGTGIEMGWSMPGAGANALASSHYHEGDVTAEGTSFRNFISGLTHGVIQGLVGGGSGVGGSNSPAVQWKSIRQPRWSGPGGALGTIGKAVLKRATDAANKYGRAHVRSAIGSAGGSGGSTAGLSGNEAQIVAQLSKRFGWGGQIADWTYVLNRESNGTLTDTNPSSGAYGLAQFINGPSEYAVYGGNANTYSGQLLAMANYIKQRYGDPAAAAAHERSFNWYAQGGWAGMVPALAQGGLVTASTYNDSTAAYSPFHSYNGIAARLQSGGSGWWNALQPHSKWSVSRGGRSEIVTIGDWGSGGGGIGGHPRAIDLWAPGTTGPLGIPDNWLGLVDLQPASGSKTSTSKSSSTKSTPTTSAVTMGSIAKKAFGKVSDVTNKFLSAITGTAYLPPSLQNAVDAEIAAAAAASSSTSTSSSTTASASSSAPTSKIAQVQTNMMAAANRIIGKPYGHDGGHVAWDSSNYDCSGAAGYVLHAAGLQPSFGWTGSDVSWGLPGAGKYITRGIRNANSSAQGHEMLKFFGHYLESGGGGPLGQPRVHWDSGWDGTFDTFRHPPGLARGGVAFQDERMARGRYYGKNLTPEERKMMLAMSRGNSVTAASGFSGVVDRPTAFLTGEAGIEHVQVTPMAAGGFASGDGLALQNPFSGPIVDPLAHNAVNYGNLSAIGQVFKVVSSGFSALDKIATKSADFSKNFIPYVDALLTQDTGTLDRLNNAFTVVSDMINAAQVLGGKLAGKGLTSAQKGYLSKIKAGFVEKGGVVTQTLTPTQQSQEQITGLNEERTYLLGEQNIVSKAQSEVKKRLDQVKKLAKKDPKKYAKELQSLVAESNNLTTRQQALVGQISQNVSDTYSAQAAVIQGHISDINNTLGVQASKEQGQISTSQTLGTFGARQGSGYVTGSIVVKQSLDNAKKQISQLTPLLNAAKKQGNKDLAAQITQSIQQLQQSITDITANFLSAQIQQVDQQAQYALAHIQRRSRIADVISKGVQVVPGTGGLVAGALAGLVQGTALQDTRQQILGQIGSYSSLLGQAQSQGNVGVANSLLDKIDELNTQLAENTQAISDNVVATRQASIDYLNARSSFQTGVLGTLYSAVQTMGQLTGGLDVGTATSLTQGTQNVLQGQQSGLLGQLSSGYGINLQGLSGTGLIQALGGLNYSQIESGMTAAQQQQFEGLISSITSNVAAIEQNTVQLQTLNGQLLGPQSFSTTAWQTFRSAIFTGMGGLLPQFASIPQMADGGQVTRQGLAYLHAAEIVRPAKSSGGDQHFHIPVVEGPVYQVDPNELARRAAWEAKTR